MMAVLDKGKDVMENNLMDIADVKKMYDGYYVYLDNCQFNKYGSVTRGRILCVEKDRTNFYEKVRNIEVSTTTYCLPLTDTGESVDILLPIPLEENY